MLRAFRCCGLVLGLTLLAGTSLPGQDPGSGGEMGGMGGHRGMGRWGHGGERPGRALPSAAQLEGPPLPDFFADRFELDSGQAAEYRVVYDSFMSATATIRDSAQTARRTMDMAFHDGDREAARASFPILRQLGDSLAKDDRQLDDRLKSFLTSKQVKTYRQWKDEQQRQESRDRPDAQP